MSVKEPGMNVIKQHVLSPNPPLARALSAHSPIRKGLPIYRIRHRALSAHPDVIAMGLILAFLFAAKLDAADKASTPAPAPADIKQEFADADKDGNGSLSLDEFVKHVDDSKNHGKQRFGRADRDEDGKLTRQELTRYLLKRRAFLAGGGKTVNDKDTPKDATRADTPVARREADARRNPNSGNRRGRSRPSRRRLSTASCLCRRAGAGRTSSSC